MDDLSEQMSMTYTPEHLLALREALASGEHRVTYDGKSIEYRSVAELKAAIAEVEATIARESGAPKSRQIRVTTSKAL
jgi:roadblock/LC7 domain-containing protein